MWEGEWVSGGWVHLADTDAHTVGSQVSQAEDAATVGEDNDLHVAGGPIVLQRVYTQSEG